MMVPGIGSEKAAHLVRMPTSTGRYRFGTDSDADFSEFLEAP
jgi:hypothetical protein